MESGKRSCTTWHSHPGTCLLKQRHVSMSTPCMTLKTGSPPRLLMSRLWMTRVFRFEADNPVSLVNSATALLQIVDETCEAHGLQVNMNDGKTEFSIEMTGVGARKQFKRLWREDRKAHCISTKTGKSARVVSRYKHVGTIRTRTQNPRDDAETKANNAPTTYHHLAHSVFRNSRISLHLRDNLLIPCVFRA